MSSEEVQGYLPDLFTTSFWQASAQEMGLYSLNMILLRAGLGKIVLDEDSLPKQTNVSITDFGLFQQALREYYGRGARGILTRAGRGTWRIMSKNLPLQQAVLFDLYHILPLSISTRLVMKQLLSLLCIPKSRKQVRMEGKDLFYLECSRLVGTEPAAGEPVCWTMLGLIQGALESVTNKAFEAEEEACRAAGAETCKFRIHFLA